MSSPFLLFGTLLYEDMMFEVVAATSNHEAKAKKNTEILIQYADTSENTTFQLPVTRGN